MRREDGRVDDVRERDPRAGLLLQAVAVGEARTENEHPAQGRNLGLAHRRVLRAESGERGCGEKRESSEDLHEFPF